MYRKPVSRKYVIFLISILVLLVLSSCEDIFHNVNLLMLEAKSNNSNYDDPNHIFLGGDFTYFYDVQTTPIPIPTNRQFFAALDSKGRYDYNFFANGFNDDGIQVAGVISFQGVRTIEILGNYIYVGGGFGGVNIIRGDPDDADYKQLIKYSLDGNLQNYKPFSAMGIADTNTVLKVLPDSSVIVAGLFTDKLRKVNSDGSFNMVGVPTIHGSVNINSLYVKDDNSEVYIGGNFSDFVANQYFVSSGIFQSINFQSIGNPTMTPSGSDVVKGIVIDGNNLYLIGEDGTSKFLKKYKKESGIFVPDNVFNAKIISELSRGAPTISSFNTISINDKGWIILGGVFSNVQDFNGDSHQGVMRITSAGVIDPYFKVQFASSPTIYAIEIQRNGKILIGGNFSQVHGQTVKSYARLYENGELDHEFDRGGLPGMPGNQNVYAFALDE